MFKFELYYTIAILLPYYCNHDFFFFIFFSFLWEISEVSLCLIKII